MFFRRKSFRFIVFMEPMTFWLFPGVVAFASYVTFPVNHDLLAVCQRSLLLVFPFVAARVAACGLLWLPARVRGNPSSGRRDKRFFSV